MAPASRPSLIRKPGSSCSGRCRARLVEVKTTSRAFALRLRPNQDVAGALEAFCRQHGILRARLRGGVGSTIGARFTDGSSVVPFATELAIRAGIVSPGANGTLEAELDVALVDYLGGLAEGRLVRGDNPVLMTMELVLEVLGEQARACSALAGSTCFWIYISNSQRSSLRANGARMRRNHRRRPGERRDPYAVTPVGKDAGGRLS